MKLDLIFYVQSQSHLEKVKGQHEGRSRIFVPSDFMLIILTVTQFKGSVALWWSYPAAHLAREFVCACVHVPSSLFMGANHDFGYKVDDSAGRLLRVVLGEQVAHVLRLALIFPGDESKEPGGRGQWT